MALKTRATLIPIQDKPVDDRGLISRTWLKFLQDIKSALDPLGIEQSFPLVNNQSSAADIEGLYFKKERESFAQVDYLIQRMTTSTGASEHVEGGTFQVVYKPTSDTWVLSSGPSSAGATLTITSAGQVQYTTSNITGTAQISRIVFRKRILVGKSSVYSSLGIMR